MFEYGAERNGVQWTANDQYYAIQYNIIRRISEAFINIDFDSAYKYVRELYDLTHAYYKAKSIKHIDEELKKISESIKVYKGQVTREVAAQINETKKKNLERLRDIKRTIMLELKQNNMLLNYRNQSYGSIAEMNNK